MASSIVGSLIIRLRADIGSYESGMRKAQRVTDKRTKEMEKRLKKMRRNVERSFRAIATSAVAVGASLAVMTARNAAAAREARDMARTLGTTAEKLQAFQYATDKVGVSSEKATDILKDLADKLGDASLNEGGELFQALESLGLSADRLQRKGPVDQLKAIGAALEGMPRAQKITVLESIGDDASRLLPLLKDNAAGLRAYSAEAREFGVAMSRVDNSKLVEADKAFKKMQGRFEGLTNQLSIAFAPAMTRALGDMGDLQKIASDPDFAKGIEAMADAMAGVAKYLAESVTQMGRLKDDIESLDLSGIASFAASRTGPGYVAQKMGWWNTDDESTDKDKPKSLAPILIEGETVGDKDKDKGSKTKPAPTIASGMAEAEQRHLAAMAKSQSKFREWQGLQDQRRKGVEQLVQDFGTREQAARQWYEGEVTRIRDLAGESEQADTFIAEAHAQMVERIGAGSDQMSAFATRAAENMQDSFADFLFDPFADGLDGMLSGFIDTMRRMAAEQASSTLFDALTGDGKKDDGGLLGKFGSMAIDGIGSYFGGVSSASAGQSLADAGIGGTSFGIPSFHTGGIVGGSGDVPAVLKGGEGVFTPQQMGNLAPVGGSVPSGNMPTITPRGGGGAGGGGVYLSVENHGTPQKAETQQRTDENGDTYIRMIMRDEYTRDLSEGGQMSRAAESIYPNLKRTGS